MYDIPRSNEHQFTELISFKLQFILKFFNTLLLFTKKNLQNVLYLHLVSSIQISTLS